MQKDTSLEEILRELCGYGCVGCDRVEAAKSSIIELMKKMVPEEKPSISGMVRESKHWNACRTEMLRRIEELR